MSALHLASLIPSRRSHLQLLSFQYVSRALPTFRHLMSSLSLSTLTSNSDTNSPSFNSKQPGRQTLPLTPTPNIHALFACASHIAYYVLAAPSPEGVDRFRLPSRRHANPHWWQSMRGFMALLNMHWLELAEGPMGGSISRDRIPVALSLGSADDAHLVKLSSMFSAVNGEMDMVAEMEEERIKVLKQALLHLRHIFASTHLPYPNARLAGRAWPGTVSQAYCELLYDRDQRALVVMAAYCVLLKRMNDVWYMTGLGAGLLENIVEILGGKGKKWWRWFEWAVEEPVVGM